MTDQLTPGVNLRVRAVNLTSDELSELTPSERRAYRQMIERHVFGDNHKKDKHGRPIEQGIGSAAQPTRNHVAALKLYHPKDDPRREEIIAAAEAALAEFEGRKRAERGEAEEI